LPADGPVTEVEPVEDAYASSAKGDPGNLGTTDRSTTETAKQQAGQVAQDAKESGKHVAGTAVEQGRQVLDEGRRQAKDLAAEARRQADEQSRAQKDKAAAGLRDLAAELSTLGSGTGGQSGLATDLAQQASTYVHDAAGWLESRNPGELVDEVRGVARRHPGTFLLGALAAGLVAGRLSRGAMDASRSDSPSDTEPQVDLTSAQTGSMAPMDPAGQGYNGMDAPRQPATSVGAIR
jgi:hypothetical protein